MKSLGNQVTVVPGEGHGEEPRDKRAAYKISSSRDSVQEAHPCFKISDILQLLSYSILKLQYVNKF